MKTLILSLLASFSMMAAPAFADEVTASDIGPDAASAYTCQLTGAISGLKIGFIFDGQLLHGDAVIHCVDNNNRGTRAVDMPVRVKVIGGGVGFDFTIVHRANLVSGGIGAVRSPADLLGSYSVAASAGVTLINRGYNVQSAISVKKRAHGLGFELGFQGERATGLGARLDGLVMVVERR